jgi:hypothetical protein
MAVGLPVVRATWVGVLVVGLLATACAGARQGVVSDRDRSVAAGDEASTPDPYPNLDGPPPVTVRFGNEAIELGAYAYCFGSVCAAGFPPVLLPDIGSPKQVVVEFPLAGWTFTATFSPAGEECGRRHRVALVPTEDGVSILRPAGHAGTYDVTLFGDVENGGNLSVTFRWTTQTDGPLPEPEARLAVVSDPDGHIESSGVELEVWNLARTPDRASARITVRSESGEAVTFKATLSELRCQPEGTVYWDGPNDKGVAAATLGGDVFMYEVNLVVDGRRYVGTGTWPEDEILGNEPSVALDFSPELPSLS